MNVDLLRRARRGERGIAAIEFALLLPFMILLLAFPLLFGRAFYCYSVAQKAAHDAALYLSSVPLISMKAPARAASEVAVAQAIAAMELAGLNPGPYPPLVAVQCDGLACGGFGVPASISVVVQVDVLDTVFFSITLPITGDNGFWLIADVTMAYVGN